MTWIITDQRSVTKQKMIKFHLRKTKILIYIICPINSIVVYIISMGISKSNYLETMIKKLK